MPLSRKTTRKVRGVEVPFGGSKRKSSLGALKWAIQVKILLNSLFKLIKGTFHLLKAVLSDLKGGRGLIFCVADCALIMAFCPLTRPSSRGRNSIKTTAAPPHGALNAPISSLVARLTPPRGAPDYEL